MHRTIITITISLFMAALTVIPLSCGQPSASQTVTGTPTLISVKHTMPIQDDFEKGLLADNVQMAPDGRSVVLYDLTLVEDDAPGICTGNTHWPVPQDAICGGVQVKKILHVTRPEAKNTHLVICTRPFKGETVPLTIQVNQYKTNHKVKDFDTTYTGGQEVYIDWEVVEIPPGVIKRGDNEIILSCNGSKGWKIPVSLRENIIRNAPERRSQPNRSFKSADGGKTWSRQLGPEDKLQGEYPVRLNARQYAARGQLTGPVVDLAALAADGAAVVRPVDVDSLNLKTQTHSPQGTRIAFSVRSGTTPVYCPKTWGRWSKCDKAGRVKGNLKRFVQWQAVLATDKPTITPVLKGVELNAQVKVSSRTWADKVRVLDSHNEQILYTSIPFEYEKFDEPKLVELRKKYKLDEVVAGAETELEKMILLRNWVSKQWKYDPPQHPYPAWDAHEILRRRQGFCVQYAIVYMQCALSLGMQTRFVFGNCPKTFLAGGIISGHEVDEFWSNEYRKWIMMDANQDEFFVDSRTGIPASMLEQHKDLLDTYFPDGPMDYDNGTNFEAERCSKVMYRWKADAPEPNDQPPNVHLKWGTVRWMPRNNFYAHRFPEPIAQGRTSWSWTGYWQWQDERTPRQWRFSKYTSRHSDIEWTINQVRYAAAFAKTSGTVNIKMATVTPDFDTFLINIGGTGWHPAGDTVKWQLHPGRNRIEMRIRNRAGVLGCKSWLELQY